MKRRSIPAFEPPRGATPAARRRALAREKDGAIAHRLVALARAARGIDGEAIAREVSLPPGEVLASPFALRMVAMAASRGASTVHAELRAAMEWPEALHGEEGTGDAANAVWDRGVLQFGKYQQFLQDEPFARFHPDQTSKWGPHELMHRAVGFFHRGGCSRWELYLGARLNELVPVVAWYGLEQAMRLDEGAFDRVAAGRSPAAPLERARWRTDRPTALKERALGAVPRIRESVEHFERELSAIDRERATGERIRVEHPFLDASSDALAYVAGHRARLEAVGDALDVLVPERLGRYASLDAYRDAVERSFDELLFAPLSTEPDRAARVAREVWDRAHRAMHAEPAAALSIATEARAAIDRTAPDSLRRIALIVRAHAEAEAEDVLATGVRDAPALAQLREGLESCAPRTSDDLDDRRLARFARSDAMWSRAPLGARLLPWLETERGTRDLAELAGLEHAIASARMIDDRVERLCEPVEALPARLDDAILVRSAAFARFDCRPSTLAYHAGEPSTSSGRAKQSLLVGAYRGAIAIVPVVPTVLEALDALADGPRPAHEIEAKLESTGNARAWIEELVGAGVIGWMPVLGS